MLYTLLRIPAWIAFQFYVRKLSINKPECLNYRGPLLIAANHPNSFLDAIVLATIFKRPVHSLTRGDVFKKSFFRKLLHSLHMLPVYRVSEGPENLDINYQTFRECRNIFRKNGIVLVFIEGGSVSSWKLRPFKKGTARLAISSWQEGIPLKILPLGINYSAFKRFGKNIELNFGEITEPQNVTDDNQGKQFLEFNRLMHDELKKLVVEIPSSDKEKIKQHFYKPVSNLTRILLFIPSLLGFILHAPIYLPIKYFNKKTFNNDHYDSVMISMLFFAYPIYLLLISILVFCLTGSDYAILLPALFLFSAWAHLQLKEQID